VGAVLRIDWAGVQSPLNKIAGGAVQGLRRYNGAGDGGQINREVVHVAARANRLVPRPPG